MRAWKAVAVVNVLLLLIGAGGWTAWRRAQVAAAAAAQTAAWGGPEREWRDLHGVVRVLHDGSNYEAVTAGVGVSGFSGDRHYAPHAELSGARGVAAGPDGNVLIADYSNDRIRMVAGTTGVYYGQHLVRGDIYTIAGDGGNGFAGDGGKATSAELAAPQGLAVDAAGGVLIADSVNQRIRVVAAATGTFYGQAMTAGDIYTIAGDGTSGFAGDGGPATAAELWDPADVAVDSQGNVAIADTINNRSRVVAAATGTCYGQAMTAGDIYPVAGTGHAGYSGDGGPATGGQVNLPGGVTSDAAGNLVLADTQNNVARVVAEATGTFYGQAMTPGDIYTVAETGQPGFAGDGGAATAARLAAPGAVAVGPAGDILAADTGDNRIRQVGG